MKSVCVVIPLTFLALTGCAAGGPSSSSSPAAVAASFDRAVAGGDFAAACSLLTPSTRTELLRTTETPCPDALPNLGLGSAGRERTTQVYGRAALVTAEWGSTFLARSGTTWSVRATGCTPRAEKPFDCALGGD